MTCSRRSSCDLDSHRLKDLTAPERIYQVGDGSVLASETVDQANLPVTATAGGEAADPDVSNTSL